MSWFEVGDTSGTIRTGVDKLLELVEAKERISMADAAKELSVPKVVIEEWVDFLEEKGIVNVEYKLTTPYIVRKKISPVIINEKKKEFESRKEGFVRKVESTMDYIAKETSGLKGIKEDFDKLKGDIEADIGSVKTELTTLEKYETLKREIDKELLKQHQEFTSEMEKIKLQVLEKEDDYKRLSGQISKEELKLEEELEQADLFKKNESLLVKRLQQIEELAKRMEEGVKGEDGAIEDSRQKVRLLKKLADRMKDQISIRQNELSELIKKSKEQEDRIGLIQMKILEKVLEKKKKLTANLSESTGIKMKFEQVFKQKVNLDILMDRINMDFEKLRQELKGLIDEAQVIQLTSGGNVAAHIAELESKFKLVDKRKAVFEKEVLKLGRLVKQ